MSIWDYSRIQHWKWVTSLDLYIPFSVDMLYIPNFHNWQQHLLVYFPNLFHYQNTNSIKASLKVLNKTVHLFGTLGFPSGGPKMVLCKIYDAPNTLLAQTCVCVSFQLCVKYVFFCLFLPTSLPFGIQLKMLNNSLLFLSGSLACPQYWKEQLQFYQWFYAWNACWSK